MESKRVKELNALLEETRTLYELSESDLILFLRFIKSLPSFMTKTDAKTGTKILNAAAYFIERADE